MEALVSYQKEKPDRGFAIGVVIKSLLTTLARNLYWNINIQFCSKRSLSLCAFYLYYAKGKILPYLFDSLINLLLFFCILLNFIMQDGRCSEILDCLSERNHGLFLRRFF